MMSTYQAAMVTFTAIICVGVTALTVSIIYVLIELQSALNTLHGLTGGLL